ncbi:phospholipase/carboxylesterase [Agrococcus baldri]|uniref:Phospholipase/carboxylesterase n=1 Tax=Agrococcus baldri TaxID=153730 RepID=A0AA94HL74_9MICO|nr:alpha/beta fold hydrolase [Agrococcus baldri]SFS03499.1 phospholipase/carboxylesterase [Agrococcus baldri]
MLEIDADVVRWREGEPDGELLVVMHGIGSHEGDLFGLAPHLPAHLTVASLRAPIAYGGGFAWFEFSPVDSDDHAVIDEAAHAVLAWLDGLERRFSRVHLLGFSQGGAMAVQLARIAPDRFASIAHLASFVHAGELPGDAALAAKQPRIPLLTTIGDLDEVIHRDKIERSAPWLDAHFDVDRRTYHRAHSIVAEELADVVAFLQRAAA